MESAKVLLFSDFVELLDTFGTPPLGEKRPIILPLALYQWISRPINSFTQKMARRIFLKFYIELEDLKGQKTDKAEYFWKILILRKKP